MHSLNICLTRFVIRHGRQIRKTLMQRSRPWLCGLLISGLAVTGSAQVQFQFTTFSIPGAQTVEGRDINNSAMVVGYYTTPAGDTFGVVRNTDGSLTYLTEPDDLGNPFTTRVTGLTYNGTVVGTFYGAADQTYSSFIDQNGQYTEYNLPGQPPYTVTAMNALNEVNDFCGYVKVPPAYATTAFASLQGQLIYFTVPNSTSTICTAVNNEGVIAGNYTDSSGVSHGYVRSPSGTFFTIDVPAATSTVQQAQCTATGNLQAGTQVWGMDDTA